MYVRARACAFRRYTRIMTEQKKTFSIWNPRLKIPIICRRNIQMTLKFHSFRNQGRALGFCSIPLSCVHTHTHTQNTQFYCHWTVQFLGHKFRPRSLSWFRHPGQKSRLDTPAPRPGRTTTGTKVPRYQGRWSHVQWGLASFRVEREREVGKLTTEPNRSSTRHHSRNYCLKKFH